MATISKSLATRLVALTNQFPTSPPPAGERIPIRDILHTIIQVDTTTCTESDPKQGDYHSHAPSIRTPSHQLTNDGRLVKGTQPTPCFSLAHANFWADALCSKFAALAPTHRTPTHKHCPNIAYPTYKYTLTLGDKVIDNRTTETLKDRYYQHLCTGFGRRLVAGWLARYIHLIHKPHDTFPTNSITRPLLLYTAPSHTRALRSNTT